jgi:hypothetical protein
VFVAYGLFAVLAAVTAGVLRAVGVDTTALTSNDWRRLGIGSAISAAVVLFISYFFGGYVAGRMARRAGAVNGVLVFVLAVLVAIAAGVAIGAQADTEAVVSNLRSLGVPTSGSEYGATARWPASPRWWPCWWGRSSAVSVGNAGTAI